MTAARFAALVLAVVLAGPAHAASTVWRLVDPQGGPVVFAEVAVVGRTGSARTAADGSFALDADIVPPFEIVVFDAGGKLIGTARTEPGTTAREIVVDAAAVELVRVVGGVAPSTAAPPAASATVRSREDLARTRPAHAADALAGIPGASVAGSGSTAVPVLRGLSRGRTLLLLDDARITTERRAGASATFVDPFTVERLEVVRGPGSVAYGSDAFGGVLHMLTPVPRPQTLAWRAEGAVAAGVPYAALGLEGNIPIGGGALLAAVHGRSFDDYDSPAGEVPYSSAEDAGVLLRGAIPAGDTRVLLGLQIDRARDVERAASDTDTRVTRYPEEDSDRLTGTVAFDDALGADTLELTAFVGRYRLVTERETFATDEDPAVRESSDVEALDASVRLDARRALTRGVLRWGVDAVSRFDLSTVETVEEEGGDGWVETERGTSIEDADRFDVGAFVEGEHPVSEGWMEWFWGARADLVRTASIGGAFGDRSTSEVAPSGYVAARFRMTPAWNATIQASSGFRDPTLSDRYYVGVTGRGQVTGNPDLDPERSVQLDVAVRGTAGPVNLAGAVWRYRILDLIERYEVAPDEFAFRNRDAEDLWGAEVEADTLLGRKWLVRAALGWTRGELDESGEPAADVPAPSGYAALEHRPADRWWWRADVRTVLRDDRPGEAEVVTPGSTVYGAGAGLRLARGVELRLTLDNLFDHEMPASSDRRAPPAPGRSAALTVSFTGERARTTP